MQRKFLEHVKGSSYENQYRFVLQTGLYTDTVFLCRKGTPVKNSTYDSNLFKICDKAGIDRFSMHILRHTFATRCIEAGMLPKTLQKIMGHSNIGITMNLYVHITEDEKQKEIDMVADALNVV